MDIGSGKNRIRHFGTSIKLSLRVALTGWVKVRSERRRTLNSWVLKIYMPWSPLLINGKMRHFSYQLLAISAQLLVLSTDRWSIWFEILKFILLIPYPKRDYWPYFWFGKLYRKLIIMLLYKVLSWLIWR